MRTGAQVHKIALLIEGDRRVLGQIADELHLVGLALFLHKANGFLAGQLEALQLEVLLDDVLHFLFDGGEEFLGEGLVDVEIVVKAVFNRGADGQLGLGAQLFHGLGHDVAGRVAQRGKAVVKMRMFLHGDPSFLVLGKFWKQKSARHWDGPKARGSTQFARATLLGDIAPGAVDQGLVRDAALRGKLAARLTRASPLWRRSRHRLFPVVSTGNIGIIIAARRAFVNPFGGKTVKEKDLTRNVLAGFGWVCYN